MSEWTTEPRVTVIGTPRGDYTPTSDDLEVELIKAAQAQGYSTFRVIIDNKEVTNPDALQTKSIAALDVPVRIEPYDEAA